MHKLLNKYTILSLLFVLTGCSVGPDYKPVVLQVPEKYKEAPAGWKMAQPNDMLERGTWWKMFQDPELDYLIAQVNVNNQNIASAVALYREALATMDQNTANYWPTVDLALDVSRQKVATDLYGLNTQSTLFNTYEINPTVTWMPDIFGAVRRAVEAAQAGAQATEAQLAETRLAMQALLAQTYFQLRAADLTQKLLDDTVDAYRRDLVLTKNKYAAGIVSQLDVTQAETSLESAQTAALDNGITRAQSEHAIAVLIGKFPENFAVLKAEDYHQNVPYVPLELTSKLLERRSDVASAERLVAQANAEIGIAVAAYFPVLTLTSNYGYSSSYFKHLFSTPTNMWSIGAALIETIFDGGARAAQVRLARATYDQKVAAYKQTVLAAFQNVEDNLVSVRILDSEVTIQKAAVATAEKALMITLNQYNAGIVDYTNVLIAQSTAFNTKATAINIYSRRLVATVGLIQALGGGWDIGEMNTAITQNSCVP